MMPATSIMVFAVLVIGFRRTGRSGVGRRLLAERRAAAQLDLALTVDVENLDQALVAFLQDVRHLADPAFFELRDVAETFGPRLDLDERAEVHDLLHGAEVDAADVRIGRDAP